MEKMHFRNFFSSENSTFSIKIGTTRRLYSGFRHAARYIGIVHYCVHNNVGFGGNDSLHDVL